MSERQDAERLRDYLNYLAEMKKQMGVATGAVRVQLAEDVAWYEAEIGKMPQRFANYRVMRCKGCGVWRVRGGTVEEDEGTAELCAGCVMQADEALKAARKEAKLAAQKAAREEAQAHAVGELMTCKGCEAVLVKRWKNQLWCEDCSKEQQKMYQRRWYEQNKNYNKQRKQVCKNVN